MPGDIGGISGDRSVRGRVHDFAAWVRVRVVPWRRAGDGSTDVSGTPLSGTPQTGFVGRVQTFSDHLAGRLSVTTRGVFDHSIGSYAWPERVARARIMPRVVEPGPSSQTLISFFDSAPPSTPFPNLTRAQNILLHRVDAAYVRDMRARHYDVRGTLPRMEAMAGQALKTEFGDGWKATTASLSNRRGLLITGFGSPNFSYAVGNTLAVAHGAMADGFESATPRFAVLGIDNISGLDFTQKGLFYTSGVSEAAYTGDWRSEMARLFLRIKVFIDMDPESPVDFYGYSKGGIELEQIMVLRDEYRKYRKITAEHVSHLPGCEEILPVINEVMAHLVQHQSKSVGLGVPHNGVDKDLVRSFLSRVLQGLTEDGAVLSLAEYTLLQTFHDHGGNPSNLLDVRVHGSIRPEGRDITDLPGFEDVQTREITRTTRILLLYLARKLPRNSDGIAHHPEVLDRERDILLEGVDHFGHLYLDFVGSTMARAMLRSHGWEPDGAGSGGGGGNYARAESREGRSEGEGAVALQSQGEALVPRDSLRRDLRLAWGSDDREFPLGVGLGLVGVRGATDFLGRFWLSRQGVRATQSEHRVPDANGRSLERLFPAEMFEDLNNRGIIPYDRHLFGTSRLELLGVAPTPERSTLGRMITSLPFGAVVADWGGGAGIFSWEASQLRPDLTLYVNDLHSPEDILAFRRDVPEATELRRRIHYLTGDGMETTLPDGVRADFLVACSLSPYVRDPLQLLTHLYNQLKPGGLLVMTLSFGMFAEGLDARAIHQEILENLRSQGIRVELHGDGLTLVVERKNEQELSQTATLIESYLVRTQIALRPLHASHVVYRVESGENRWIELVEKEAIRRHRSPVTSRGIVDPATQLVDRRRGEALPRPEVASAMAGGALMTYGAYALNPEAVFLGEPVVGLLQNDGPLLHEIPLSSGGMTVDTDLDNVFSDWQSILTDNGRADLIPVVQVIRDLDDRQRLLVVLNRIAEDPANVAWLFEEVAELRRMQQVGVSRNTPVRGAQGMPMPAAAAVQTVRAAWLRAVR